ACQQRRQPRERRFALHLFERGGKRGQRCVFQLLEAAQGQFHQPVARTFLPDLHGAGCLRRGGRRLGGTVHGAAQRGGGVSAQGIVQSALDGGAERRPGRQSGDR